VTTQANTVVTGNRQFAAVDARPYSLTVHAAVLSVGSTSVPTTATWRPDPRWIDRIAERERREFEDSLRAQVQRLRQSQTRMLD
jgi:hypothetical protein